MNGRQAETQRELTTRDWGSGRRGVGTGTREKKTRGGVEQDFGFGLSARERKIAEKEETPREWSLRRECTYW